MESMESMERAEGRTELYFPVVSLPSTTLHSLHQVSIPLLGYPISRNPIGEPRPHEARIAERRTSRWRRWHGASYRERRPPRRR